MQLHKMKFGQVNLNDPFFDSLKQSYSEFSEWFQKKENEEAFVFLDTNGNLSGFLYLKIEDDTLTDIDTEFPQKRRLKIGTFKIDAHGTRLGERFIKKSFDYAVEMGIDEIYLTIFEQHEPLIDLFLRYGFEKVSTKTSHNGKEIVLAKQIHPKHNDPVKDYPLIPVRDSKTYLLGIYPKYHTRLFPDSKLINEGPDIVQDVSHTNSIHKIYLSSMNGVSELKRNDVLIIYRTKDDKGPAHYRSVVTSACVVEDSRSIFSFANKSDFLDYCSPYSVFNDNELNSFWNNKKYKYIIRFTYNAAFKKRLNRQFLIDNYIIDANEYAGFTKLDKDNLKFLFNQGQVNESIIIY